MHHFADTITSIAEHYGLPIVFVSILLDSFGFPSPGESMLVAMSAVAAKGGINIWGLLIVSWLAAVVGDNIGYAIGCYGGRQLVTKYGQRVGITDKRLARIEHYYKQYGSAIIILSRFFIPLRQLNGIVAGIVGMNFWRFFAYNVIGALLWVGFWIFGVSVLIEHFTELKDFFKAGHYLGAAAGLIVLAAAIAGLRYWIKQRKTPGGGDPPGAAATK